MPNQNHPATWVVVADNCQARIYRVVKFPKIEEIAFHEHPESRLRNQDLISTRPGHGSQSTGSGAYSYQSENEPRHLEASKFATDLVSVLSTALKNNEFNRLYVIAAPSFLGLLRQHISPEVQKTIVAEGAKEFSNSDLARVEHYLTEL